MPLPDLHGIEAMESWPVPEGLEGPTGLLRVQVSSARPGEGECAQRSAARAHPAVWPRERRPRAAPGLEAFALRPAGAVLDMLEFDGLTPVQAWARLQADSRPHEGLLRWTEHAVAQYLAAGASIDAARGTTLGPVSRPWVMQSRVQGPDGPVTYELCAWGRGYQSDDGGTRELRVLRARSVTGRPAAAGETAVAAMVLARGRPSMGRPRFREAHVLGAGSPVARIRVVEIGCEDASYRLAFEGTADEAEALYDAHARGRLRAAVTGGEYRPGDGCPDCKLITVCPALPRRPGILGISDPGRRVRTWSVTNGRHYQDCPAQDYLERLHLPRDASIEYGSAARRGQAVHAWLAERHARRPAIPCTPDDVPDSPDAWSAGGWEVSGEEARLGVQMIGDHSLTCALRHLPAGTLPLAEHRLSLYDPDAAVVVIAKTDLLYQDHGGWVLRETKTTRQPDEGNLLTHYPQIALGIVLLAEGVPGGTPDRNRVELERLTPAGPLLDTFDPADPVLLAEARDAVRGLAAGWHADTRAAPAPGLPCRTCSVRRWCPDAAILPPRGDGDAT